MFFARVSQGLDRIDFRLNEDIRVPEIEMRLNQILLSGGKRFRPLLALAFGRLFGLQHDSIAPFAKAAEWVHAATLIHDDVIDESKLRRGKPSFPNRTSNARAVLAGDLLLSHVMCELSSLGHVAAIASLSKVIQDMVRGEWLQLESRGSMDIRRDRVETVAKLKTGALIGWSCSVPAMLQECSAKEIETCREIGHLFGFSFQLIDDTLDFSPNPEKPYGQDLSDGLLNSVMIEMLDSHPEYIEPVRGLLFQKQIVPCWKEEHLQEACRRIKTKAIAVSLRAQELLKRLEPVADRYQSTETMLEIQDLMERARERIV